MITTEERPTVTAEPVERADTRTWLTERISADVGVMMAATWYVLLVISIGLEPEPTGAEPGWAVALGLSFWALLAVTAVGLLARRRWGLVASLGAAGMLAAFSVACPVSDHHGLAAWWFGQFACTVALVAASGYALTRSRA